ncbi:MAG: hypothetical protein J7J09_06330 [Kosmotoga sp.]|uniref:hypothetical protein n=1 Tax=Kosmotoga sp. TaxID=1955248 RepID=UPI0025BB9A80|nr:hypothetical protein [Kosmotoga sp.]MCD6160222.1 hypothetical protein [Kosmotoga sp.]
MDEENKTGMEDFFERLESESLRKGEASNEKGSAAYIAHGYEKKLARKQSFLTKKGVPRNLFWGIVIGTFIISFLLLVGWPLYKNFSDLSYLLKELEDLEKTYYSVNVMARSKDAVIGTLKEKATDMDFLVKTLGIEDTPGSYDEIKLKGSPEKTREILEGLLNNPKILIKDLQLRSNLGFPVVPKTDLPANIVLELSLDIELTNLF